MAASGMLVKLLSMGLVCMLVLAPYGEAAISCSVVYNTLYPCLDFVMRGGQVQPACCNGIKSLYGAARTPNDRQSVCSCLKTVASNGNGVNFRNAADLPGKCGVSLPYQITPSIDCKSVR